MKAEVLDDAPNETGKSSTSPGSEMPDRSIILDEEGKIGLAGESSIPTPQSDELGVIEGGINSEGGSVEGTEVAKINSDVVIDTELNKPIQNDPSVPLQEEKKEELEDNEEF